VIIDINDDFIYTRKRVSDTFPRLSHTATSHFIHPSDVMILSRKQCIRYPGFWV
jgi:hypothetical protein